MAGLFRGRRDPGWQGKSGFIVMAALLWLAVKTAIEFWGFPSAHMASLSKRR